MKANELKKGMVLNVKSEQWKLTSQKCHIVADVPLARGSLKVGDKIPVDNHRRNKWMAKRVTDGKEQLFCFDIGRELPEGVVELENTP